MNLSSLRLRLMGLALVWVVLSLVAAAVVLQYLFAINIERTMRSDMEATLGRLAAVIMPEMETPAISAPLPDPLYSVPLSGKYWQIEDAETGETTRSRSLWDLELAVPDAGGGQAVMSHVEGPSGGHLLLLTQMLEMSGPERTRFFRVTVGEDHAPIDAAISSFNSDAAAVLALLGSLLILAAWLQIVLGLSPLTALRRGVEAVRQGSADRLRGKFPSELAPLVEEVNALLESRETSVTKARERAADLAHGLKTPLAALHGVAERLRAQGEEREAHLIDDLAFEMSERVDHQLRLAVLHQRTSAHTASTSLNTAVLRTLTVLKKTARGETLHWVAQLGDDCQVDMHRQDLLELVGIVLENAAKWAEGRVTIRGWQAGEHAAVSVEDDGPGIAEDQLEQLGRRGVRLDESKPGSGLGLAMAAEILEINRGAIAYDRAESGGLKVTLTLPLAARG